ncbi:MAG: hypothetical protein DWQ34_19110 [Planctomycetota bacterium]|nr:MAG: hypothetical protein DWQ34_19110 [Planctomycetota bacterium]REK38535.1 MAG: hypothetical protein DWQ45_03875 [Planctomycetota bacterium]
MKRVVATVAAVLIGFLPGMLVGEDAPPALSVGDEVAMFYVKDVTGPAAGKQLCYRCRYGDQPVVAVFTRRMTDEVTALVDEIDGLVDQHMQEDLAAFVVLMDDDPVNREDELKRLAREKGVDNVPLTTFDDVYGPRSYRLERDADVTVMMWVDRKVRFNRSFANKELTEESIAELIAETATILE